MIPPIRLCCGQSHFGAVCPDGKVMCQLCYSRFPIDQLNVVGGRREDVCRTCACGEKAASTGETIEA